MAQQSARRGRKNQMYSSCLEHAFMIWFRSANSHTGPQHHRCIRGGQEAVAVTSANPRPYSWPPSWFTDLLAMSSRAGAAVFVIEAWVGKRWRPIALSDYEAEASARRLFKQASYTFPVETLLRLRRGSDVLIKQPADGRANVRE